MGNWDWLKNADLVFCLFASRARCDDKSKNNAKDLRPDRKQTSPFVQPY